MNIVEDFLGPVISTYTRAQALKDGVLVDVSPAAKEAGFVWPVAVTSSLFRIINTFPKDSGQDLHGRLWDVLMVLRFSYKKGGNFKVRFSDGKDYSTESLYAVAGPGDNGEPVITIMREGED